MVFFTTVIEIQMTAILNNADSDVHEPVDPCNNSLTILFSQIKYIKVHTATRWTIRHSLMLLWFADLMNVTEEVTIHRPNVSTLLSSAFIRGDLNAATRGPFI